MRIALASDAWTPQTNRLVFTYQLWVLTQINPLMVVSAGVMKPDANGRTNVMIKTPPDLPKPAGMALTIEPEGGVPTLSLQNDCVDGAEGDGTIDVTFNHGTGDYSQIRLIRSAVKAKAMPRQSGQREF